MARIFIERFPIRRVIPMADRSLLGHGNIDELSEMVDEEGRKLEFNLAVPSRRCMELAETFGNPEYEDNENEDGEKYARRRLSGDAG